MSDTSVLLIDIKSVVLSDPTLFKHLEAEKCHELPNSPESIFIFLFFFFSFNYVITSDQ